MLSFQDLRIAVLCSKSAPGLNALLRHPHRGTLYDIACVISTDAMFGERERVEAANIPVIVRPLGSKKLAARPDYDEGTAHALEMFDVDIVVLLSYLYILTAPMLTRYPERIVNIHDSDLTLRKRDGRRRYVGLHSTRDAVIAGETETRSSIHLVTESVDAGPVLTLSEPYPVAPFAHEAVVAGQADIVRAYAYAHREWMIRDSWGPLLIRTIENFACGHAEADLLAGVQ